MKTQFSVGLLGTLASMLLFIENASAADFSINQAMYNSFCGYNPTATGSALCFDTDIDIRQHLKESTPGVVVYMTDDLKHFAVPAKPETMYFSMLQHKVAFHDAGAHCVWYGIGNDPQAPSVAQSETFCLGGSYKNLRI